MKKNKYRSWIQVIGAREHNLKNITVALPKEALTVITGPSGSGKSSLALDILYTEGKRRYTESLSAYARQFLGIARKPEVDRIEGLCPAIAIEQKTVGSNPRSTVGTITEIFDYMRVLFARVGKAHCPECKKSVGAQSPENITYHVLTAFVGKESTIAIPLAQQEKGEFKNELERFFDQGFYRCLIDGVMHKFKSKEEIQELKLGKTYKHTIDIMLDTFVIEPQEQARLQESIERALQVSGGFVKIIGPKTSVVYSSERMCVDCGISFPELEPRFFSFNSPVGACQGCFGLGFINQWPWKEGHRDAWKMKYPDFFKKYSKQKTCQVCFGLRLNPYALAVTVGKKNIIELSDLAVDALAEWFSKATFDKDDIHVAQPLLVEIQRRLKFLNDVGLSYLTLNRSAKTLSGGEGQRIRLATQIGSALSGVLYILDEPSIGLHQRDNDRLIKTLQNLKDQGNTVVVVEHDIDTMKAADYIIDMGPGAGAHGGTITAVGSPEEIEKNKDSLSGGYMSGRLTLSKREFYRTPVGFLILKHASKNNLKDLTVRFPLGVLCGVSGVSGSGKSTLLMEELVPALQKELMSKGRGQKNDDLVGVEQLRDLVVIDQDPIGKTSRSNPATYLGIFDEIRALFARLPESNIRGYEPGRFSFNRPQGRCFECNGDGTVTVSMHFLADVTIECKACHGKRYNKETLQIRYRQKNIADILSMTAQEAADFFKAHKQVARKLQVLCDVGLGYLQLGQSSTTLSGGEAQRIKLVHELAKRGNKTLYVLDEPTTGLHQNDIEKLLIVLNNLVDKGNSIIVIEHNTDVLKRCDYLLDLGPEGGQKGGELVAFGTPAEVARSKKSIIAPYLRGV